MEEMECSGQLLFPEIVVLPLLHAVSALFSLAGNFLVLTAIRKTQRLHSVSNYFIASLAGADFMVGALVNPLFIARSILNIWDEHHGLVIATEWVSMLNLVASTFNLAAVSVDRYVAVTSAFRYQRAATTAVCISVITFNWVFSSLFSMLRLVVRDPLDLPKLWIAVAVVGYTLPFGVISFCYYHIYKIAREQTRRITAATVAGGDVRQLKRDRKAAYTVGVVIGVYVLLALPSMAIAAVQLLTSDDCLKIFMVRFWYWGALFSFASAACNPWIYAFRSGDFRQAFKRILKKHVLRQGSQIQPAATVSTSVAQ